MGLSPGEKIQSRVLPLGTPLSLVPLLTPTVWGLPSQWQQPWSCDSPGLLSFTLPGRFRVSLSLAHTPCLLCQMTKKEHYSASERFILVDKNEFQLAYFQMIPCDLWPVEMVVLSRVD